MPNLNLKLLATREGIAQYQIFVTYNKAIVDILDTTHSLIQNSKYLKSDLITVKNYIFTALSFLKKAECISETIFTGNKCQFDQLSFLKDIVEGHYVNANTLTSQQDSFTSNAIKENNSEISAHEFIKYNNTFIYK